MCMVAKNGSGNPDAGEQRRIPKAQSSRLNLDSHVSVKNGLTSLTVIQTSAGLHGINSHRSLKNLKATPTHAFLFMKKFG